MREVRFCHLGGGGFFRLGLGEEGADPKHGEAMKDQTSLFYKLAVGVGIGLLVVRKEKVSVFGEGAFCYTNLKSLTIQKFLFILIDRKSVV